MRRTLLYLNFAHFLDHYFLLIFPTAVLAIHPEWGMGYGETLALATPAFLAFGLATPLAGWLGDRYGERPLMIAFFIGIGAASVAAGFAVGPVSLAIALAVLGLFASIYHPVGIALLVRVAEKTGAALGVNGVFGNMGVAAAAGFTGIMAATIGWRATFILPGLVSIALGIAFALHVRSDRSAAEPPRATTFAGASRSDVVRVLLVVAIASLFGGLAFNGVTIALPKLFEERLPGIGLAEIGLYTAAVFALAAFTQIPAGRAVDRIGPKPVMMVMTLLQAMFFVVIAYAYGFWAVVLAVPLMLAVFGEVPVSSWLVSRYVPTEWRGRAYSVQFLLGLGVSALVVPLIAVLHGHTGNQGTLFIVLGGAMVVVFTAAWLLPHRRPATATSEAAAPAQ